MNVIIGTTSTRPLTTGPLTTRPRQLVHYYSEMTTRPQTTRPLSIEAYQNDLSLPKLTFIPGNGTSLLFGQGLCAEGSEGGLVRM